MGAGLIPIPLLDIAAVTSIQIDMLKQLAFVYDVDFSASSGKAFVTALTGSTLAALGASLVKALPGVGTVLGGLSMSALSGASTYGVGQVAASHFASGGGLVDLDAERAKKAYKEAFRKGKEYVKDLEGKEDEASDVYQALDKLGELKKKGVITDAEFEAKKKELLDRL
jgi:uncharacterized protein (DUF697 family)